MKLAFLTMVWRDYWLLEKWVAHNAALVPRRQLYVVNHGDDPEVDRIASGCNVIHVPRDGVTLDLTRRRWDLLGGIANGLLAFFDRVVCTDVDELLVYAGPKPSLTRHLAEAEVDADALSPVGLNLIPTPEDPEGADLPVLARHPHALLSAKYTKPCIAARPVTYTVGGHGLVRGSFRIDPEIVLVHLHYVTPDYAERMSDRQRIVADSKAYNREAATPLEMPGRHWINWAKPEMIRDKEFGIFVRARALDVSAGFAEAATMLEAAVTRTGKKSVVDPSVLSRDPVRITLPEALRSAI
jgi:hypothetical protein